MSEAASNGSAEPGSLSQALHEQFSESQLRSSPTRRTAAHHSNIELVGRSQAFIEVMKQVERISETNLPALLTGEPGTGKELVAAAIHHRSDRAAKPFVALNCAVLPAESIEAEWEEAEGGTVFLNEISETSLSFQGALLRALQTGALPRAGSNQMQKMNVRLIAGSNRNLEQEVSAGRFRNDLFSRLNAASIVLPPLRERPEDIRPLAQSFVDRVYSLNAPVKFAPEALALLERYGWPGNIRELENVIVRAVVMCDGTIQVKDLPQRVRNYTQRQTGADNAYTAASVETTREEWLPLSAIEGRYVAEVLEHTHGNKQAAARVLAIDRKTLDRMIKRHHIDYEKSRRGGRT